jgi:hypothetical protein
MPLDRAVEAQLAGDRSRAMKCNWLAENASCCRFSSAAPCRQPVRRCALGSSAALGWQAAFHGSRCPIAALHDEVL